MSEIIRVDIPQTVSVRKYPVDCKLLCQCLREHKNLSGFSNREISETLYVPITKVEHWFRQDDCFSIPEPELWLKLKTLLGITTDEFDESVMTFEEKDGVYEKSERHYHEDGIMPTLTSTSAGVEKIITRADEPFIVASRGRNPENPSDRTVGSPTEQRLEPNSQGIANTLTTVLKDNYVAEPQPQLRIRKLTPKECYRLQGFSDEAFAKAESVCSNTQLYKQAGNSICVPVLEHLFENLRVYLT